MLNMTQKENKYFKEIAQIEDEYYSIICDFDLSFPKALNLRQEKRKFFRAVADDKYYNPQIRYSKKNFDEKKVNALKKIKIDTKNDIYGFKKLYKARIKTKLLEIECHKNWGKPISTKYVKMYRGSPSRKLLSIAKVFCKNYKREKVKFKTLDNEIVAKRLKKEVFRLTGDKPDCLYVSLSSKIAINPSHNIIKINPHIRLTSLDVKRLKVHEIGVHYMRYFNAKQSGIKILQSGTSNYIETEEGLAVYCEELKEVLSSAQMFIYAGRVIATFYAPKMSFYEVFCLLKEYGFKNEDAFAITFRAKRNISDTSQKGGFTKDYVYFSGYLKIKKYAQKHNLKDLFIGKIKLEDLKLLKKFIKNNKDKIKTIFD